MTTHTPGPWITDRDLDICNDGSIAVTLVQVPAVLIADVSKGPQAEANARLIAAVPDLLTAAKNFVEAFGAGEFDDPFKVVPYVDRFNAAIAKATKSESEQPDEPDRAGYPDLNATDYREELHRGHPEAGR